MDDSAPKETGEKKKCIFYDLKVSNNAARIRIWLRLMMGEGLLPAGGDDDDDVVVETVMIPNLNYLYSPEYEQINPIHKCPALITDTGMALFESFVIMEYLQDKYGKGSHFLLLKTPEERAFVNLLVRMHDIYIASPNCTQPHFSHTQGCMYLDPIPTTFTAPHRTMDSIETRAAKLKELYQQLTWLERQVVLPYLASADTFTHADCTWFPTCVFMEYLLPLVFDWSPIFHETKTFPKLTQWFSHCMTNEHFRLTHEEISSTLKEQHVKGGRFVAVQKAVQAHANDYQWKYM